MLPLISFVQNAAYASTPVPLRLPRPLWHLFTLVNKVHAAWRWYRKAELYINPDRFFQLLAGHALHFIAGDLLIIRIAAQSLLIATRILECSRQQAAFYKEGKEWLAAIRFATPPYFQPGASKKPWLPWLSPSTCYFLEQKWKCLIERMRLIAYHTLKLLNRAFRLSMGIMDVLDAMCLNPDTRHDAMRESVVNLLTCVDAMAANEQALLAGLSENRPLIERLLEKPGITYEQFFSAVSKGIEGVKTIQKKTKVISPYSKQKMLEIGKKAAFNSLVVMGLAHRCQSPYDRQ